MFAHYEEVVIEDSYWCLRTGEAVDQFDYLLYGAYWECQIALIELGCRSENFLDQKNAGLHRLRQPVVVPFDQVKEIGLKYVLEDVEEVLSLHQLVLVVGVDLVNLSLFFLSQFLQLHHHLVVHRLLLFAS